MKPQAGNNIWTASLLFTFHHYTSPFLFLFKMLQRWFSLMITRASPLTSHPPPLPSLRPAALKDTGNLSPPQRANPLCPNFNWATNPPGLSKQWAPSAADNLACPPPHSLLSRAGLGPASVTVSNSGTAHLHRKCELLTKWLTCLQHVCSLPQMCLNKPKWQPGRIML